MNKQEFLKEHRRLLKVLKSGSKKERLKEYDRQKKEVIGVLKKNGIGTEA